jgi:hypothetical protein
MAQLGFDFGGIGENGAQHCTLLHGMTSVMAVAAGAGAR